MSTAVNPTPTTVPTNSRPSSIPAPHPHGDPPYTNGHAHHHHPHDGHPQSASNAAKKGKQKKAADPNEASKLIAAKISQLELGAAEDKEQEAEIGWFACLIFHARVFPPEVWQVSCCWRYFIYRLVALCAPDPWHVEFPRRPWLRKSCICVWVWGRLPGT